MVNCITRGRTCLLPVSIRKEQLSVPGCPNGVGLAVGGWGLLPFRRTWTGCWTRWLPSPARPIPRSAPRFSMRRSGRFRMALRLNAIFRTSAVSCRPWANAARRFCRQPASGCMRPWEPFISFRTFHILPSGLRGAGLRIVSLCVKISCTIPASPSCPDRSFSDRGKNSPLGLPMSASTARKPSPRVRRFRSTTTYRPILLSAGVEI